MLNYKANFSVNNGTTLANALTSTNKQKLIKEIRDWAAAERFAGNEAKWWVEDEEGCEIASGLIDRSGKSHRTL